MKRSAIVRMLNASLPLVDPEFKADANETLIMARKVEHFFARIYEKKYPEFKGRAIMPVNHEVPTGARTYTYMMSDDIGAAQVITDYANDLPMIDANATEFTNKIVGVGAAFGFSIQDIRTAQLAGTNIDTRKADIVRRVMEQKVDQVLCTGDAALTGGLGGFANNANVTFATGLTGTWQSATAAQIQADVEKICLQLFTNCKGTIPQDKSITLAVDIATYTRLAALRLDTFNQTTVLRYLLDTIPFLKEVVAWERLSLVASSGTARRLVAYYNHPDTLEAVIPQEFEMLPMQPRALSWVVPCHMRTGGVKIVYPRQVLYADGT